MPPSRADDVARKSSWRNRQLALDLAPPPRYDREDFLVSDSNERAFAMVELWPDWPDPVLLILGPAGAGKSHLGAIWAQKAKARILAAPSLAGAELEPLAARPLLIENLDAIGDAQAQLFHLVNLMRERGLSLVLTARERPEAWNLAVADLLSRLRLAPRVEIGAPDETLIRAVLVKLLGDRQLVVDQGLIDYAVLRLDRSLDAARAFVDALDQKSLSRQTRVTRALASEIMHSIQAGEESDAGIF